jgi:CubicO group peptidase (beta-lactamase class C family)
MGIKLLTKVTGYHLLIIFIFFYTKLNAQSPLNSPKIAYSQQVSTIEIDGKINDWPVSSEKYSIENPIWEQPKDDISDFSAYFMIGHNLADNSLYIAVVVQDDIDSVNKDVHDLIKQDSYFLFINEKYDLKGSGIAQYSISENGKELGNFLDNWDPNIRRLLNWEKLDYKIAKEGNIKTYELKFTLEQPIFHKRVIGLCHIINDSDDDEKTSYAWVNSGDKDVSAQPGRMGMLVFLNEKQKLGTLTGKVSWKDTTYITKPEGLTIISKLDKRFWVYTPVNQNGEYSVVLPEGQYELKPGKTAFFNGATYYKADTLVSKTIIIKANESNPKGNYTLEPVVQTLLPQDGDLLYNLDNVAKHKIDETIKSYMDYYEIPGAAFAAFKDGKISYQKTYGVENNYTKERVTQNTLFEVASITKPVFAFAVLRLYEKGIIDLDKPLYEYLPFKSIEKYKYFKLLTARIVLSHKTGLPNWGWNQKLEFKFKPGTAFGYSGEGYEYLKRVVEKVTNKDIDQVLHEEVVEPLGLRHMYFQKNDYAAKFKSHGHYNGYPGKIDLAEKPWVAGCLITNAQSFVKFLLAVKNRKGLKPETFKMMLSPQIEVPESFRENNWGFEEYMGLGIFVEKTTYGRVFRHSGNNGDFRAIFRIYDDLDMGYIIMTNGNTGKFLTNSLEKSLINIEKLTEIIK